MDYVRLNYAGLVSYAAVLQILDVTGAAPYQEQLATGIDDTRIDLNNLSVGYYICVLTMKILKCQEIKCWVPVNHEVL